MSQIFEVLSKEEKYEELYSLAISKMEKNPDEAKYWLVHAYYGQYDFENGITKGVQFLNEIEHPTWRGRLANRLGSIYWITGNFKNAEMYMQMSKQLLEEHGTDIDYASILNNLGVLKDQQGDLGTALEFFEQSVELKRKSKDKSKEASTLVNISIIYKYLGEYERALELLELAFSHFDNENTIGGMAIIYQERVIIRIYQDRLEEAKIAAENYEKVVAGQESIGYKSVTELNHALILKHTKTLEAKGLAIIKLKELSEIENISIETKLLAMKNYLELKLEEFRLFQNDENLAKIDEIIQQMDDIAQRNKMYPLIIDMHILKAKLKQIQGDFNKVQEILMEAEKLIQEQNLEHLLPKLKKEISKFEESLMYMKELVDSNASLVQRMKSNYLEEYLKSLKL